MAAAGVDTCSIIFKVCAHTNFGDELVLVGESAALGDWDPRAKGVRLSTTPAEYPVWSTAPLKCSVGPSPLEYKYVRLLADGGTEWEVNGENRKLLANMSRESAKDVKSAQDFVVDDGRFGQVPVEMCGYPASTKLGEALLMGRAASGPQLLILGDEVAAGSGAWCLGGWSKKLVADLHGRFGYGCCARVGRDMDVYRAEKDFEEIVASSAPKPLVVLVAFSAGLAHVSSCPDWDREPSCTAFLQALEGLVGKIFASGAYPVIAGLCPHGDCGAEHAGIWRQMQDRIWALGVPVLDWLHALVASPQESAWAPGLCHDAVRPNGSGHQKMFACVDASVFDPATVRAVLARRDAELEQEKVCFSDGNGFQVACAAGKGDLVISNSTQNDYELNGGWGQLQDALAAARCESPWCLQRGLYISYDQEGICAAVALDGAGRVASAEPVAVPAGRTLVLQSSASFVRSSSVKLIFAAGPLTILTCAVTGALLVLNEATFEYNVHPMWNEARLATRKLPEGIYEDGSGKPFRAAVISLHGLQSRIKVPGGALLRLARTGPLSSVERVALLPLGDRCSIRMLLHKIELDGPCYPFDLTRTTSLADVADMVGSGFEEMWREELLQYDHDAGRVFHKKWGGLSFAHEVDDGDDPVNNFRVIAARMAKRYAGRSERFDFAIKHADRAMFIRTGCASRGEVENMLQRLHGRYPGLKATFLLISDQPSHEFQGIPGMTHICEAFDPDRMYEDMSYWINSAHRFRGILEGFGITARTLYWCPNNLREAEREMEDAAAKGAEEAEPQPRQVHFISREVPKFSHSSLFEIERRPLPGDAAAA